MKGAAAMPMGMPQVSQTRMGPTAMTLEGRSASRTLVANSSAVNLRVTIPSRALVRHGRGVPEPKVAVW